MDKDLDPMPSRSPYLTTTLLVFVTMIGTWYASRLVWPSPANIQTPTETLTIGEFQYQNCTYIYVKANNQHFITHKGNCTNNPNFAENENQPPLQINRETP